MELKTKQEPLPVDILLDQYRTKGPRPLESEKIHFEFPEEKDIYNITAPFDDAGRKMIAARVEARDSEDSEVYFFKETEDHRYVLAEDTPVFQLQDPFVTKIHGELVFGGVEIFPKKDQPDQLDWRTVFFRGKSIQDLQPFFEGPIGMKDIRLCELPDGSIAVFTRPQGKKGGRGKIGYARINKLEELTIELIDDAPLFDDLFLDEEWGGANEIHVLGNGLLGVLGHIAKFDEKGERHYYPMVFAVDPYTAAFSKVQIIAERSDFQDGPAKRPDLVDVVFSGGLIRRDDGLAELYAGTSDAEAQKIIIPDPLKQYENRRIES